MKDKITNLPVRLSSNIFEDIQLAKKYIPTKPNVYVKILNMNIDELIDLKTAISFLYLKQYRYDALWRPIDNKPTDTSPNIRNNAIIP